MCVPIRAPTAVRRGFERRKPSAQRAHPVSTRKRRRETQGDIGRHIVRDVERKTERDRGRE